MNGKTAGMRLILRGFDSPITYGAVQYLLDKLRPEYCLFLHDPSHFPDRPPIDFIENVIVEEICIYDLKEGDFPLIDKIEPLDEEFLYKMSSCEAECLKMMDRIDPNRLWPHHKRKNLYLDYLRKWNTFINQKGLNTFLSHSIPHHPIDFIPYNLIRRSSGKIFFLDKIPIPGRIYLCSDWELIGSLFRDKYNQLLTEVHRDDLIILDPEFEEHFKKQTGADMPHYLHIDNFSKEHKSLLKIQKSFSTNLISYLKKLSLKTIINKIISLNSLLNFFRLWEKFRRQKREENQILGIYDNNISMVDLSKPFIFVPLHLQPEATTSPMGGVFVDQELMISILSYSIPSDWFLYIKENVFQSTECRSSEFYKELLSYKNVKFIDKNHSSLDYVLNCKAVATVTGTAGWEAIHRQKPVLIFGHCFYQFAPGVLKVNSLESCMKAIKKIQSGFIPDLWEVRLFLKAIHQKTFKGFNEPRFGQLLTINNEENSLNIGISIAEKLS